MRALHRGRPHPSGAEAEPVYLPVLRPGDWDLIHTVAHRSLLHPRRSAQIPIIAVARPTDDGLDLLRPDALDVLGMSWRDVLTFAVQQLAQVEVSWDVVHKNEGTGHPALLGFESGGVYSASRVLDRSFMQRAHDLLQTPVLLACMPTYGQLFVTHGGPLAERSLTRAFRVWARRHYAAAAGVDALSYQAFVLRDGQVIGIFEPPE